MPEEQVRCNVCSVMIGQSQAKDHASTALHAKHRSELEKDLEAVRKNQYGGDSSVVLQWAGSV